MTELEEQQEQQDIRDVRALLSGLGDPDVDDILRSKIAKRAAVALSSSRNQPRVWRYRLETTAAVALTVLYLGLTFQAVLQGY